MSFTIDQILGEPTLVSLAVERLFAQRADTVDFTRMMSFQEVASRTFRTTYGALTATRMASVLAPHSGKVLRGRNGLVQGTLELADLGDKMQMDNDRLEMLSKIASRGSSASEDIVNFLVDDFSELVLAPYKRMDKVVGDLRSLGSASVKLEDNPGGIKVLDMQIPINKESATAQDKGKMLPFLQDVISKYADKGLRFETMEMNNKTFQKLFGHSSEFVGTFKASLSGGEASYTGYVSVPQVNALLESIGLPKIHVNINTVTDLENNSYSVFADDRIALLPAGEIGKMRYKLPYELSDRVPNVTYSEQQGGMYISTKRTEEGRFIEMGALWIPEVSAAQQMVSIDLSKVK